MASFTEHINQAKSNLSMLSHTNKTKNGAWDWQVTMCFYVAVHLINGHIAKRQNLHYRSHKQVKHAISPYKTIPIGTELSDDLYKSYVKLQNLSRRSRYLCQDTDDAPETEICYFTYDKHLKRAVAQLDKLMSFIQSEYNVTFDVFDIDCIEIKGHSYSYFKYNQVAPIAV